MEIANMQCEVRLKLKDDDGQAFVGIGSIWLLENIQSCGSIRAAAAEMELSYPKALKVIKALEEHLGFAVVARTKGGNNHGGAELTPGGLLFLEEFRKLHNEVQSEADRKVASFWSVIKKAKELALIWLLGLALTVSSCAKEPTSQPVARKPDFSEVIQVVDAAGRTVNVPKNVRKVAAAGPPAAVVLYAVAPQLMAGWCTAPNKEAKDYLLPEVRQLPVLGRLSGRGGTASYEQFIKHNVELIVDYGDVGGTYVSLADRVERQTGIPYLLLDGSLENAPKSLEILGKALGKEEAVAGQIALAEQLLQAAAAAKKENAQRGKAPKIYLAKGADGLETAGNGAIHSELLRLMGLENCVSGAGSHGLIKTSLEHIYASNPDYILTNDLQLYQSLYKSTAWQGLSAIKKGQLKALPEWPFGWLSDPPSINRLLGIPWLLVLTGRWTLPQAEEMAEKFHEEFFHGPLSPESLQLLREAGVNVQNK